MDAKVLNNAKRDLPKYFEEFKAFWDLTIEYISDSALTDCYAASLIFKNWKICLNHIDVRNLDKLLNEIHEDINASFFHSFFGHYRSAHMHLRSVIELSLQLLYFAQHEVEYSQWQNSEFRIKHDELTNYLKKHPTLKSPDSNNLINSITKDWIHFSKHIHAEAPDYFQSTLLSTKAKKISKMDFEKWKANYLKTAYQINKLFLLFYKQKINTFPSQNKELLLRNMKVKDLSDLGMN